jgi:hypothetical protein
MLRAPVGKKAQPGDFKKVGPQAAIDQHHEVDRGQAVELQKDIDGNDGGQNLEKDIEAGNLVVNVVDALAPDQRAGGIETLEDEQLSNCGITLFMRVIRNPSVSLWNTSSPKAA